MITLIESAEVCPGLSGPTVLLVVRNDGILIEIGHEGINTYTSLVDYEGGAIPFQSLPMEINLS